MPALSGNTNLIFYPAPSTENYQTGKVTLIVDEDISGIDRLTNSDEFDLQFNFFSQSGTWWQIIIEPGTAIWPNMFQLWRVDLPTQNYKMSAFSIGSWADFLRQKGTIASFYWAARDFEMYSAFLEIRNPSGISNKWHLNFDDFSNSLIEDFMLNSGTDRTQPGACMHVFSITGSDGASFFTASSGKGRIIYEGLVPDPTGASGTQTAESSSYIYGPVTQNGSAYEQTFSL